MNLTVQSIHFDADQKLVDYVNKKTEKLSRYFERITDGEVFLKLSKPQAHNNKIVEIKIFVPGQTLFVSEQSDTFEAATDLAVTSLKPRYCAIRKN
ncbi:MAG: HPF/RaiA family ribosome-associated protein [Bacteroidia bacterium]